MKKIIFPIFILALAAVFAFFFWPILNPPALPGPNEGSSALPNDPQSLPDSANQIIVENLNVPWDLAFLPDGSLLVTERPGRLKKINGEEFSIDLPNVEPIGEGGLLGLALHPEFTENNWLYLYYTTRLNGKIINTVRRFTLLGSAVEENRTIISDIPGAANHNGGRIRFGPDGFLYITTGDAQNPDLAQDTSSLAGKILRVDEEGGIPADNPFANAIFSYGHRNPQGLAWDSQDRLWATEHGRSGLQSGLDELNLIEKGANYGWPLIQGDETQNGMRTPAAHSGPNTTWAPSGASYYEDKLFFAGLRGQAIFAAPLNPDGSIGEIKAYFKNEYGRLRNIAFSNGFFYLLSSNTDGRADPSKNDDKIIKIPHNRLLPLSP